ncbi:hypothetical protein PspLS_03275 [Pyricularia sp. CBS 133598]|nr:hypothetical protein PspLS_03275 [Pyricularia sp. CBS 133598]
MVSFTVLTLLLATNTLATEAPPTKTLPTKAAATNTPAAAKDPDRFIVFFCNRHIDKCPHRREITKMYEDAFKQKRTELVWQSTGYNGYDKQGDDWAWVWSTRENPNYYLATFILNSMGYGESINQFGDAQTRPFGGGKDSDGSHVYRTKAGHVM